MASDIVITPSRGSTSVNAKIDFTGASTASSQIRLEVLPDNSLAFVGTTGSLFSIADSVTGSLMSVNDASGLPILEVFDTDKVVMGQYNQNTLVVNGTNTGVGTGTPTAKLHVAYATAQTSVDGTAQLLTLENSATTDASGNLAGIRFRQTNSTNSANGFVGMSSTGTSTTRGSLIFAPPNTSGNATEKMRLTAYGTLLVGDTVEINSSWWNNGIGVFGKNATDKILVGYLASSTTGALVGAHNSALTSWAPLNVSGSTLNFRIGETSRMFIDASGNITTGVWNATVINSTYGGTGVNNGGRTLTLNTNSGTITFSSASTTLTVANNASVSGTNTGDQTTVSGNAGTATTLQTARNLTINGTAKSFNGSADISWTAAEIGLTSYLPLTGGTISSNLAITGNLTVNGTTTTVNSTTVTIDDPIFTLGGDTAPASDDNKDRGIEFRWHNGTAAKVGFFGFDDSTGYFTFIPDSTNTSEVFSGTQGDIQASNFRGNLIGNATTATTWQTLRTLTIGATGKSVDGSASVSWSASEIGTSANTASTLVARDASGNFTINTITAGSFGGTSIGSLQSGKGSFYQSSTLGTVIKMSAGSLIGFFVEGGLGQAVFSQALAGTLTINGDGYTTNFGGPVTVSGNTVLNASNYNTYSPTLTGTGASGTWGISISGNAATATSADQIDGVAFRNTGSNAGTAADSLNQNGITYVNTNISLLSQTDGALYSQAYDANWQHQIYGDYRTGQIVVRGKQNATWQAWRTVLDSSNYTTYVGNGTLTLAVSGNGLSGSASFTANQSGAATFTVTSNATSANTASTIMFRGGSGEVYVGDVYSSNWFRNTGSSGLYNSTHTMHFYAEAGYYNVAGGGSLTYGGLKFRAGHEGTVKGLTYWDNDGFGLLNQGGHWAVRVNAASLYAGGSLYGVWDKRNASNTGTSVAIPGMFVQAGSTGAPSAIQNGDLWWNTETGKLKIWYGTSSAWVDATSVPDLANYFPVAGGNITGNVSIGGLLNTSGNITARNGQTHSASIGHHPTYGASWAAVWRTGSDYALLTNSSDTLINAPTGSVGFRVANTQYGHVATDGFHTSYWFRNDANNTGLYNTNTTQHLSSQTNGYWDMSSTATASGIRLYTGGHISALRGYVYANNGNEIGFLNHLGTWSARFTSALSEIYQDTYVPNLYANLMYDRNDTAYYCDPANICRLYSIRSDYYADTGGTHLFKFAQTSGVTRHLNLSVDTTDPSTATNSTGISWGSRSDSTRYYMISAPQENWNSSGNYTKLELAWHTGIRIGASTTYGGTRFFNNSPGVSGTEIFSVGRGDNHVRVENNLYAAQLIDIGNTTYYVDPASSSRLNGGIQLDGSLGVGTAGSGTAGEIRATNNITAYYSDDRLKTKLGLIENPIEKVKSLSGFYFEANDTAVALGYQKKREVGVSAQEVQAILPEIIAPAPIDDKYMTVRYEKLIPLLIEAIKAQQVQIEELQKLIKEKV